MSNDTNTPSQEAPESRAYIEELERIVAYEKRRADRWRGIASAMGYEPAGHLNVRPTEPWLLERIARFRADAAALTRPLPSVGGEVERVAEALFRAFMSGDTNKLTTTALPDEWRNLQPSYRAEWLKVAAALTVSEPVEPQVHRDAGAEERDDKTD